MKKLLIAAILMLTGVAQAQELKEVQIVGISASKLEPVTQTKFNTDSFSFLNCQKDPFFVLDKVTPAIYSQSDNGEGNGYAYMRLRGLDQTRINYNLNGIPMNEMEDQGLYFSNMPGFYNYISTINVQRGIGSSKYGNTAVAGSVDMETFGLGEKRAEITTLVKSNVKDKDMYSNFIYSSGINKNIAVQLGGSVIQNEGFKDHSNNNGGSVFYSVGYFKKNDVIKIYGFSGFSKNQLGYLGIPLDTLKTNYSYNQNWESDKDTFQQHMVCLNWVNFKNSKRKFNTSVYYSHVEGNYNSFGTLYGVNSNHIGALSNAVITSHNGDEMLNIGINTNIYMRKHYGSDFAGYYFSTIDTLSKYTNTGHKQDVSAYVKGLGKNGIINISYDIQLRSVWFNTSNSKTYNWIFLNPKFGIKTTGKKDNVYFNAGITQREPTRSDMIQNIVGKNPFGANTDNTVFLDSSSIKLKPEIVTDVEIGNNYHYKNLEVNLNAYILFIQNEYVATGYMDPASGFMIKKAVDVTIRKGIELNTTYNFKKLKLFGNAALQNATIASYDTFKAQEVPFAPKFIASLGASYSYKFISFGLIGQNISSMAMNISDTVNYSNSYSLLNGFVNLTYKNTTISLKVDNLFNDRYYIPAGVAYNFNVLVNEKVFYAGQLRAYNLTIKYRF